jgi:type IV pilus assembly protein PilA
VRNRNTDGFSLIELLIVVTIIGIISAIAIPNLMSTRRAANEGSAQSSLRTINSAEAAYQVTAGGGLFGDRTALHNQSLIDTVLNTGTKSGYLFGITPTAAGTTPIQYYATATPVTTSGVGATGTRRFGISEDGVLHGDMLNSLAVYADENAVRAASATGN